MPTGAVFNKEEIDAIAQLAEEHDLWVVNNSVTSQLMFDGTAYHHIANWPGMRKRTITLGGVSKDFNMTAWRVGWAAGDAPVMEHIGKAHMYNGTLTGGFAQAGVIALLTDDAVYRAHKEKNTEILQERCAVTAEGLNAIPGLSCVKAQGGWWLLLDHRDVEPDAERFARFLLEEANVAVTPHDHVGTVDGRGTCADHLLERARRTIAGGCGENREGSCEIASLNHSSVGSP